MNTRRDGPYKSKRQFDTQLNAISMLLLRSKPLPRVVRTGAQFNRRHATRTGNNSFDAASVLDPTQFVNIWPFLQNNVSS